MGGFKGMSFADKSIKSLSSAVTKNLGNICDAARIVVGDLNNDNNDDVICLNKVGAESTFRLSNTVGFSREYQIHSDIDFGRVPNNRDINNYSNEYYYVAVGRFKPNVFSNQIIMIQKTGTIYNISLSDITLLGSEPNISIALDSSNTEYFQVPINNCDNQLFYKSYIPSVYQEYFPKGDFNNDGTEDLLCVTVEDSAAIAPWFLSFDTQNQTTIINSTDIDEVKCNYELPYNHFPVSTDDANHIIVLKTTIRTADLNGDGYADIICTNKVVHSNTHVEATSHSFLNQYGTTTIKMAYGGILLTERYDHHFIEFNGQKGADLLTIFLGRDIKYKVYSDGVYIGPDEVEPNRYGDIPFQNIHDRCFADKVVTGDFNGDGRQDFMCLTGSAIGGTFEKDHTLVGISDEGEAPPPKKENIVNNSTKLLVGLDIDVRHVSVSPQIVINKQNIDFFSRQSSFVYNNISVTAGDSGQSGFSLQVWTTDSYTESFTISNLRSNTEEESFAFTESLGVSFSHSQSVSTQLATKASTTIAEATHTTTQETTITFGINAQVSFNQQYGSTTTSTSGEDVSNTETKSHIIKNTVNTNVAPGECAVARMDFIKLGNINLPYHAKGFITLFNFTSVPPTKIEDTEIIKKIMLENHKKTILTAANGEHYFNLEGTIETAAFTDAYTRIETCDISVFEALIGEIQQNSSNP